MLRRLLLLTVMILTAVPVRAAEVTLQEIRQLRHEAARRKRRIVVHSDGVSMDPKKRFLEPGNCVLPYLPGTQTDACTYSLIHQFPVVRLYRSKVGQEWPPGIIEKMYGDGPDGLEIYIDFCRKNNYEAFWAMRTNDTHDAGGDAHGLRRWNSNKWKQAHPEYLVASRENHHTPYGRWSAYDYAHPEVREKVFRVLEEVCRNYEVDGLLLDFFRHLPTLKSTVSGGEAGEDELAMITSLFCRTREMMDQIGAKRGRPILLAVRTPDSLGYCRALGLDLQRWMKEKLIDIWIVTGYFRLQEWHETVKIGHQHGVPVWASMDESRVQGRDERNSLEAYRARVTNAFGAGVDAVWLFNFFYYPKDPQFKLLTEAGDPATLAHTDKMYVADARGQDYAGYYLKGGKRFFTRPPSFSPKHPVRLETGKPQTVNLLVGDDVQSARAEGFAPRITLAIQASPGSGRDDLLVQFNGQTLADPLRRDTWVDYAVKAAAVKQGTNRIEIARGSGSTAEPILRDLQLRIKYKPAK